MNAVEILEQAKIKIIDFGWVQGAFYREGEGFCAIGAMSRTISGNYEEYSAMDSLNNDSYAKAVECMTYSTGGNIIGYNDLEGRTKEEILAAFDRAIECAGE